MEKTKYQADNEKVYPSDFIMNRCTYLYTDENDYEVYEYTKHGKRETIRVRRDEIEATAEYMDDMPYGYHIAEEPNK